MLPLIVEIETSDPDDFMTLLWLGDHPKVDLRAVCITPGTVGQCRVVRWALDQLGKQKVPIGAFDIKRDKNCVSAFHYKVYGDELRTYDPGVIKYGPDVVGNLLGGGWPQHEPVTYLCESAPKNLGQAHRHYDALWLDRWVQQGFFAGDNLVDAPLDKFKGKLTCPSFNPGGDPKSSLELLESPRIRKRLLVSKNVCHGVRWTPRLRNDLLGRLNNAYSVDSTPTRLGIRMMLQGLAYYEQRAAVRTIFRGRWKARKPGKERRCTTLLQLRAFSTSVFAASAKSKCIDKAVSGALGQKKERARGFR